MTSNSRNLVTSILSKIEDQADRAEHLLELIPDDKLNWFPCEGSMAVCEVLGHLLECFAGFCATSYVLYPQQLAHFADLRNRPVNHCCSKDEARERIAEYLNCVREGFRILTDEDLSLRIPTVLDREPRSVATILLGNLEHLTNHKYQLFFYLKLLGLKVATVDLYRFSS